MNLLSNKYLMMISRFILGFVFIYAGVEKISDPDAFAVSITNYKLFPLFIINFFAIVIPWIELICGLLLLFGFEVKENVIILNLLLVLFIVLIFTALVRGLDIDCGCFGTSDGQKVGILKIVENLGLLLLGLLIQIYSTDMKATTLISSK